MGKPACCDPGRHCCFLGLSQQRTAISNIPNSARRLCAATKALAVTALCRHETDHGIAFSVACYESPLNRAGVGSSAKVGQHCAGLASHCHARTNTEYVQPSTNIHLQGQSKMYFLVKSRQAHTDCFAAHMLTDCGQERLSHALLCRGILSNTITKLDARLAAEDLSRSSSQLRQTQGNNSRRVRRQSGKLTF